jgi:hypothetical protein
MKQGGIVLFLLLSAIGFAQQVKLYPGARLDEAATNEARAATANQPGIDVTVYMTEDSFDKVYAYFKKNSKEYKVIGARARKLPNGQALRDAFFILDEGDSLVTSKRWVKLQRPYIGQYGLSKSGVNNEIRDITAIVLTRSK